MNQGKLYLIPSALGEQGLASITEEVKRVVQNIDIFIAEEKKSARRFLRSVGLQLEFSESNMISINKNKPDEVDESLLKKTLEGKNIGLLSEAGLPCIADPGNYWVKKAHKLGIEVQPLCGPSSIILALIASGFNGQQFRFIGYLPMKSYERNSFIKDLEKISSFKNETQIFIETPYRNNVLLEELLSTCSPQTMLCIASCITLPNEKIKTKKISEWKISKPDLHHKPTVFLLYAGN